MANRKGDVDALIRRAKDALPKIEAEYGRSLHAKVIEADLRIDIKNFCENLRSALDYIARDIVETHCPGASVKERVYFPITRDAQAFQRMIAKSYPALDAACPVLHAYLSSIQPFHGAKAAWLGDFATVTNENKHDKLVEQKRTETRQVTVSNANGAVRWGPGVTFGSGVSVMGVPIDPRTQLPVPNNVVKTEIATWVDFRFDGIDTSALSLLRTSLDGVIAIRDEAYKYL